jgi:hypothetical protein
LKGTSAALGEGIALIMDGERSSPVRPRDTGSTAQYQPEFGRENRRSPRLGPPVSPPAAETPTEPIRLNRCAESRLSKPRSLVWR